MRVLLLQHGSFGGSFRDQLQQGLAVGLTSAGQDVAVLHIAPPTVTAQTAEGELLTGGPRPVGYREAAEFTTVLEALSPKNPRSFRPSALSKAQVVCFRTEMREILDAYLDAFRPDIIHCLQAWITSALVLETGVPYVVSVMGRDAEALRTTETIRSFGEQGVQNASRVITTDALEAAALHDNLDVDDSRIVVLPPAFLAPSLGVQTPNEALTDFELAQTSEPLAAVSDIVAGVVACAPLPNELSKVWLEEVVKSCRQFSEITTFASGLPPDPRLGIKPFPQDDLASRLAGYALADVVLLPPPVRPLELDWLAALACGTPILAAGRPEELPFLDPAFSACCPADDPAACAQQVLNAVRQNWKVSCEDQARHRAFQEPTPSAWVRKHIALYQQVLSSRF